MSLCLNPFHLSSRTIAALTIVAADATQTRENPEFGRESQSHFNEGDPTWPGNAAEQGVWRPAQNPPAQPSGEALAQSG